MFRRTFWFTAGAAAGVWATTKVNRKLKQLTPESLAAQAANKAIEAGHRLKDFALDVREGMAQREAELDEALGLNTHPELPAPRRVAAIENSDNPKYSKNPTYVERSTYSYNRNEDH
ncbi:hypothetical protein GCM10011579_047020 [Streptomyces albiflavescens]|uniref:Secreted protein n=1 Tax=Streptomyces albiflavescens TaxID=1623582 RepID=A0A917Y6N0_9ACTN|nr:DUF6167 family protein [Streptomyces albiflavescens]GGN71013.1 hypothetical protein GCM10011579_047020 [Streptomyces albiflavescens]